MTGDDQMQLEVRIVSGVVPCICNSNSPKDGSWYNLPNLFDGAVNFPVAPAFKNFPHSVRHYPSEAKKIEEHVP